MLTTVRTLNTYTKNQKYYIYTTRTQTTGPINLSNPMAHQTEKLKRAHEGMGLPDKEGIHNLGDLKLLSDL